MSSELLDFQGRVEAARRLFERYRARGATRPIGPLVTYIDAMTIVVEQKRRAERAWSEYLELFSKPRGPLPSSAEVASALKNSREADWEHEQWVDAQGFAESYDGEVDNG